MTTRTVVYGPDFPPEMLDAVARTMVSHYDKLPPEIKVLWHHKAADALGAALDGYAMVPLTAPDEVDAENTAYWGDLFTGSFVSARPPADEPGAPNDDGLHGVDLGWLLRMVKQSPERAETLAGWLVAGARHARPQPKSPPAEPDTT